MRNSKSGPLSAARYLATFPKKNTHKKRIGSDVTALQNSKQLPRDVKAFDERAAGNGDAGVALIVAIGRNGSKLRTRCARQRIRLESIMSVGSGDGTTHFCNVILVPTKIGLAAI